MPKHLEESLQSVKGKLRALALLEAADRASLTPISVGRIHALAYLGDMLSPVWGLLPFDKVALKTEGQPFFASFQQSVDHLVFEGLVEVFNFSLERDPSLRSLPVRAEYGLRYESKHLQPLIDFMEQDVDYSKQLSYFEALAVAMSRLKDDEIAAAAEKDSSWEDDSIPIDDLIEIRSVMGLEVHTATSRTLDLFDSLTNDRVKLTPAASLRLYASYLSERLRAA